MFSWLISSGSFANKCLKTDIDLNTFAYFINETCQYGKLLCKYNCFLLDI